MSVKEPIVIQPLPANMEPQNYGGADDALEHDRSVRKTGPLGQREKEKKLGVASYHLRSSTNATNATTSKSKSKSRSNNNRIKSQRRQLDLSDAENDNYWSTSLYSKPPILTSSRCVGALHDFFAHPSILAVATESSSHPTGLQSVLAQPWLFAGGGLGNMPECPLQTCLAGAGTRRDSITFASVCVPYECHAQDLAAKDFPASLTLAATDVLTLVDNPQDDDDVFEFIDHPERNNERHDKTKHDNDNNANQEMDDERIWWHSSPAQQRAFAEEYITLNTRISTLNEFLQTGWTCGNYQVPFQAFPFGAPFLLLCAGLIILTLRGTYGRAPPIPCQQEQEQEQASIRDLIETDKTLNDQDETHDTHQEKPHESSTLRNTKVQEAHGQANYILSAWDANKHCHTLCTSRHEATACLDGLRVGSILWVILGHVMAIQSSTGGGYSNPIDFLPPTGLTTTFLGQLIFASRFAVDTFLVISGYLLVIVIVRKAPTLLNDQRSKIATFFQLIGLRLLRILPLYLLCLGFFTQVAPHLYVVGGSNNGGGPFWYQWDSLLQPCRDYGWTNLLFVNNFIPLEKSSTDTCFYHSWYLAVDMQLFVLFGLPVTFFIFLKNPTLGKRVTLGLWVTSVGVTAYLAYVRRWSINTFDGLAVARFDIEAYAKPHVRGQAYFAGMYVAMMQLTRTSPNTTEVTATLTTTSNWKYRVLLCLSLAALWCVTFCTVSGAYARRPCQYTEYPMKDDCGSLWSPTATFLYAGISRAVWSCSIGILMTVCLDGKGGWLNRFLSWHIWAPLSQLSFGAYLIHPIVIFVWLLGMRQKNVYSLATFGMSLTSVCSVSFGFALLAAIIVEFPMATLMSRMIKKKTRNNGTGDEASTLVSNGKGVAETEEPIDPRSRSGVNGSYGATSSAKT